MDILTQGLNPDQRDVVMIDDESIACIAGAGSGKTRCLAHRIARLMRDGCPPQYILAVTFTRAATEEMTERLKVLLERLDLARLGMPEIRTLHGWCSSYLRRNSYRIKRSPRFAVYDQFDREDVIRLVACDLGDKKWATSKPATLWKHSGVKDEYYRRLEQGDAVDLKGLLYLTRSTLQSNPTEYRHVLVDESQDTNALQWEIIDGMQAKNLFMVGDGRQAIYRFQGAEPNVFLQRCALAHTLIQLPQNYRSTPAIVTLGNGMAADAPPQEAIRDQGNHPDPILYDCEDENEVIRQLIGRALESHEPEDIAVLGRTWGELAAVHSRLQDSLPDVPLRFCSPKTDAWDTPDGRQLARVIQIAANPHADQLVRLVVNWAASRVSSPQLLQLEAMKARRSFFEVLIDKDRDWGSLVDVMAEGTAAHVATAATMALVRPHYETKGLQHRLDTLAACAAWLMTDGRDEWTPADFIDYWIERGTQERQREADPGVTITTMHGAKGLEWPVVILIGVRDGNYPSAHSKTPEDKAEDRRLLYVGVTRARDQLWVTKPNEYHLHWQKYPKVAEPSPFFNHDLYVNPDPIWTPQE